MDNQKITIVTAFFDIGREHWTEEKGYPNYIQRSVDKYFEFFSNLAKLNNEIIVFVEKEEHKKRIELIRKNKPTKVILFDFTKKTKNQISKVIKIQNDIDYIKNVDNKERRNPEYTSPEYVVVTNLKIFFVNYAIRNKLINNNLVSWIDFGYVRKIKTLANLTEWKSPIEINKMMLFSIRKFQQNHLNWDIVINNIFSNIPYIMGGGIIGNKESWIKFYKVNRKAQRTLLKNNIIDDDQGVYLLCLAQNKDLFTIKYLGKDNWFGVFKKFNQNLLSYKIKNTIKRLLHR